MNATVHLRGALLLAILITGLAFLAIAPSSLAQDEQAPPTTRSQNVGEAEVALQGYYLGGTGQSMVDATGTSVRMREFVNGVGLLSVSFQGYGSQGTLRTGENYVDLQNLLLLGQHWRATAGDFHLSPNLVANPFSNIYTPEIMASGFRMEISGEHRKVGFFVGQETLQDGPRITFLERAPQSVAGAYIEQSLGKLELGLRYLHFDSSYNDIASNPLYFPTGRQFRSADSLALQSKYNFTKHLKWYTETSLSQAREAVPPNASNAGHWSLLTGPSWESDKFTLRGNYVSQPASYFPVLGFFAGDRRGLFVDGRYRLNTRLEVTASANDSRNNLSQDAAIPTFHSRSYSVGGSALLPSRFAVNYSLSIIDLTSSAYSQEPQFTSDNRQFIFSVNRPTRGHGLRFTYMDLALNVNSNPQAERSFEAEDTFVWKKFSFSGAVRSQTVSAAESRDTMFYRGSAQLNLKRINAYAFIEKGNDLVNRTIFSTNSYSSTVVGVSAPLRGGWQMQFEAFRNNLNTLLNPQNIFVMQSEGIGISDTLSSFNQWTSYFKIVKRFQWGGEFPSEGIEQYSVAHNPVVGMVEGIVSESRVSGRRMASGIPVSLDGSRTTVTDAAGHFRFGDVPVGSHAVSVYQKELPAEFEVGPVAGAGVVVQSRSAARADLEVVRLTSIRGRVLGPKDVPIDNVVIRLAPTQRYTTADADGNFTFYNLREGDYEVMLDSASLPEGCELASKDRAPVSLRLEQASSVDDFQIQKRIVEKPVRLLFNHAEEEKKTSVTETKGNQGNKRRHHR